MKNLLVELSKDDLIKEKIENYAQEDNNVNYLLPVMISEKKQKIKKLDKKSIN